jgi:hypothetical protein
MSIPWSPRIHRRRAIQHPASESAADATGSSAANASSECVVTAATNFRHLQFQMQQHKQFHSAASSSFSIFIHLAAAVAEAAAGNQQHLFSDAAAIAAAVFCFTTRMSKV